MNHTIMHRSRNIAEVPNELVTEILLWLPVKSLLRFKSVCKYWKSLIDDQEFISNHHQRGKKYFLTRFKDGVIHRIEDILLPSPEPPIDVVVLDQLVDQLPTKLFSLFRRPHNGIFCLDVGLFTSDLHLWNPATKELKALPQPTIKSPRPPSAGHYYWCREVAFGFDSGTNDCKVVIIHYPYFTTNNNAVTCPDCMLFAEVYSLRSDSWRQIDAGHVLPSRIFGMYDGSNWDNLHIEGLHYWLLWEYEVGHVILSFDFAAEVFTTTSLPPGVSSTLYSLYRGLDYFFLLNGCIAFLNPLSPERSSDLEPPKGDYEIWVLNEIGNEESWTNLYKFERCSKLELPLGKLTDDELFAKSESGEILGCTLGDPNRMQSKCIEHKYSFSRSYAYQESLMKLKSGKELKTKKEKRRCRIPCFKLGFFCFPCK